MSLVPKIEEVSEFAVLNDVDLACITDTWLKDRIVNNVVESLATPSFAGTEKRLSTAGIF